MSRKFTRLILAAGLASAVSVAGAQFTGILFTSALAADPQATEPAAAPPPAAGGGWTTSVSPEAQPPAAAPAATAQPNALTPEQTELVRRISAYFNSIEHLQGRFTQVSPNNDRTSGKFYVRRPGLLRFDYALPSKLRIVADGEYLSIEDHDLKTVDQYPLDATPFGLLLGADVDLTRDANVIDLTQSEDLVSLTVEDRRDGSRGRLQLFFALPDIELREWVITDQQGLDTRIQLVDLVAGKEVDKDFFKSTALDLQSLTDR